MHTVYLIYLILCRVVKEFEKKKDPLVQQMNELIQKFTTKQATIDQLEPSIIDLGEAFNEALYHLWKDLMTNEIQLYEQCEVTFAVNKIRILVSVYVGVAKLFLIVIIVCAQLTSFSVLFLPSVLINN